MDTGRKLYESDSYSLTRPSLLTEEDGRIVSGSSLKWLRIGQSQIHSM